MLCIIKRLRIHVNDILAVGSMVIECLSTEIRTLQGPMYNATATSYKKLSKRIKFMTLPFTAWDLEPHIL